MRDLVTLFAVALAVGTAAAQNTAQGAAQDAASSYGEHYSPLTQINRRNVRQLKIAWIYNTGEKGGLQTKPLVIGRVLYCYSPTQKIVALDAASGKKLWTFDAGVKTQQPNRGLAYWTDGKPGAGHGRILASVLDHLYALDPLTGRPIRSFGRNGSVDLRQELGEAQPAQTFAVMTTPGVIYKDLIITGFREPEVEPAAHGDIRAWDVRTGKLRWSFHTIPHPGEPGYETWPTDASAPGGRRTTGAANNWTGLAVDRVRGIVYAPTGSAVTDFYGADRLGNDLYADTLLALDANTGKLLWHFQGVHHDIWDRDFPSPPSLITVRHNGRMVDAVAQTTKQGFIYVFDRATGEPLFPIEERPFPASDVPGERTSPTQPVPLAPEPFARQRLTEAMLTERTPEAHAWAVEEFKKLRSDGQFLPFTLDRQTVVFPGFDGGAEWGGSAVDPAHGVLYINANEMVWTGGLTPNRAGATAGETTYLNQCSACHGGERKGAPPAFPSLVGVSAQLPDPEIAAVIRNGKGRMPSSPNLDDARLKELITFLHTPPSPANSAAIPATVGGDRSEKRGAALYDRNCAICHGEDLAGAPSNYPGLIGARARLGDAQILANIHNGKGRMPALPKLSDEDTAAILRFLGPGEVVSAKVEAGNQTGAAKFRFTGYRKFLDPDGYPAFAPPWGTLSALNLNTGKYLWQVPLGEYPALAAEGMKNTGCENYGGPVLTASGLVIISATVYDRKIRAFNSQTGELLWEASLPFSGVATPTTYMAGGKQYIVIATSGQRDPKGPQGAEYVAFALP